MRLRAAGDPTRLRILKLLQHTELTVSELTQVLGQSQPRVSRHLKVLCEAGLLERFKEGSWVFLRSAESGPAGKFNRNLAELAETERSGIFQSDAQRLNSVREARAAAAAAFFKANAADWERIRALHVPDHDVEQAILRVLANEHIGSFLDAGTGTGRMLELLAPHIRRGIGVDTSPEMLAIARDRLERIGAHHCQIRLADVHRLPFASATRDSGFDLVLFHQVLHYLDDPQSAVAEVVRVLKPGGRLLIADFAPHALEFLRDELAHRRLGFSDHEVEGWFAATGLKPVASESISPTATEDSAHGAKLTVKIWVAALPAARKAEAA
jgi:ArsR family transcriptional regulator